MRSILIEYEGIEVDNYRIDVPAKLLPAFKEMIARGCNTWQDEPPEIEAFKDELLAIQITNGKLPD